MARLSQRELLNEGIASTLGRAALKTAKGVASAAGHIAMKDPVISGWAQGAKGIGQAFGKGWESGKGAEAQLEKFLKDSRYYTEYPKGVRGSGKQRAIDVWEKDFDAKGQPKKGRKYSTPLILKLEDGAWEVADNPRRPVGSERSL